MTFFWDYVIVNQHELSREGPGKSLISMMNDLSFSQQEFDKLSEAKKQSDDLVNLETVAMAAVKGKFKDKDGIFSITGEPDMELARRLVHGDDYHKAKSRIMQLISEFQQMLEVRTAQERIDFNRQQQNVMLGAIVLTFVVFTFSVLAFMFFKRSIYGPLKSMREGTLRVTSGDYSMRVDVACRNEIALLAKDFNVMVEDIGKGVRKLRMEISEREKSQNELAKSLKLSEILKSEADAAKQEAETVARMNASLTELSAKMENVQDIATLTNKIVCHIARVLNIPLAGFFVLNRKNVFKRVADYGYPENKDLPDNFKEGEGFVGQTAKDMKPIMIEEIPEYARITLGFGEAPLKVVFVYPLIFNDQTIGILELGSLEVFSENQINWIERASKSISAVLRTIQDLSEIRHNEKMLRESEVELIKLSSAVEQSPATVVITDAEGKIEYVNPKFTQITGYTIEEAIGENPRILKSCKTPPEVYEQLWKTITSGNEWRGEFCNKKKNGKLFWEFASISPVRDNEGVITNFIAIKENITTRKKAEKRLRAQHIVTQVYWQNLSTIKEASSKILQAICMALEWELGEIWIFDSQDQACESVL